jgi:hypothetical protein
MLSIHTFQLVGQRLRFIALTAIPATMLACATSPAPFYQVDIGRATVTVTNQNWSDVRIYVIAAGTRANLGVVPTGSTMTFGIPRAIGLPADLEFMAASTRGDQVRTESISTRAGDAVLFNVEDAIVRSSLLRRR